MLPGFKNVWGPSKIQLSYSKVFHHFRFQGSLIASMLTGMYYFGRRYTLTKYFSVLMVTVGIIICTIESGKEVKCCGESTKKVSFIAVNGANREWQ